MTAVRFKNTFKEEGTMAQTLKFKRGLNANFGSQILDSGEPAFILDTGKLYIGDGTNKVLINPDNVTTATKLQSARTIAISGDGTGSASFDGSANATITLVLAGTGVSAGTYTKVTVDSKGRITSTSSLTASDIPALTLAKISDAGTAASKNVGTASGNVPVLDSSGKLDSGILPAIAITDTFVVASQAAMLALTAEVGDIAVRTDLNKCYILKTDGASTLANWQELLAPLSSVTSVAGKTGVVTLTSPDVGLGNVTNESKSTMFTNSALTGTPTATTATAGTNTTQIATTAFVTTAVANKTTITGNAGTATTLQTARTIALSGGITGTATSFNGSANITIPITSVDTTYLSGSIDGGTF